MDHNTVTIAEDPFYVDGVLHRKLVCTCGWEGETQGLKSESMARHHILFTHGRGFVSFMGSVTGLELDE